MDNPSTASPAAPVATPSGVAHRVFANPKSSVAGVLIALTTITGVLSAQGITLGHAGSGTVVALVSGLATAILGLLSKD
jgi:hypothetical protein